MTTDSADATRSAPRTGSAPLTVYYDGACPICSREIATYRRAEGANRLDWIDVSTSESAALGDDLTAEQAMARMHVREADGTLVDGAAAFAAIWQHLPRTRWLGKLTSSRPVLWVLEPAYRLFLKIRPLWRR